MKKAVLKTETAKKTKTKTKKEPVKKTSPKKEKIKAKEKKTAEPLPVKEKIRYFQAIGRRKTAVARVRLFTQEKKDIIVNKKTLQEYFSLPSFQKIVTAPLEELKYRDKFGVSVRVKGGGLRAQAEAVRHGIARALVLLNPYFKKCLKKLGFLTRDPRMRERKKFGLKRARRAPQWSKR